MSWERPQPMLVGTPRNTSARQSQEGGPTESHPHHMCECDCVGPPVSKESPGEFHGVPTSSEAAWHHRADKIFQIGGWSSQMRCAASTHLAVTIPDHSTLHQRASCLPIAC